MKKIKRVSYAQKGVALFIALIIAIIIFLMSMGFLAYLLKYKQTAQAQAPSIQAAYLADSGVSYVIAKMIANNQSSPANYINAGWHYWPTGTIYDPENPIPINNYYLTPNWTPDPWPTPPDFPPDPLGEQVWTPKRDAQGRLLYNNFSNNDPLYGNKTDPNWRWVLDLKQTLQPDDLHRVVFGNPAEGGVWGEFEVNLTPSENPIPIFTSQATPGSSQLYEREYKAESVGRVWSGNQLVNSKTVVSKIQILSQRGYSNWNFKYEY